LSRHLRRAPDVIESINKVHATLMASLILYSVMAFSSLPCLARDAFQNLRYCVSLVRISDCVGKEQLLEWKERNGRGEASVFYLQGNQCKRQSIMKWEGAMCDEYGDTSSRRMWTSRKVRVSLSHLCIIHQNPSHISRKYRHGSLQASTYSLLTSILVPHHIICFSHRASSTSPK